MYIMIDGKFGIKSDESNFILFQLKVYGNKSKNKGQNYIETLGYFNSFERALKRYVVYSLLEDEKLTTLNKVLVKLGKISTAITKVGKGLK